jgi:benzoylformate decarboxylase
MKPSKNTSETIVRAVGREQPIAGIPDATEAHNMSTVRSAVFDLLRAFRMTTMFGNPGSTELPMLVDFPADFRYVLGLQEAAVVAMADGYAQATHNAALVNLHSAAGVGHAMGSLFTAFKNHTPMVITAGQQARAMQLYEPYLHSSQATELPKPYVKWSCEPARAEDVPRAIARAYYTAMMPPQGPVFVSIPVDDWSKKSAAVAAPQISGKAAPDPALLTLIGDALTLCESPALVVGDAIDRSGGWADVVALAERHRARVWVAPMSSRCSFPETHRLFAGFLPAVRDRLVHCLSGHDLILVIGAPAFTYHVDSEAPWLPAGAALYQLTDDPTHAAAATAGTAAIGDIALALQSLLNRSIEFVRDFPLPQITVPRLEAAHRITTAFLMQTIDDVRDPGDVIVEEAPSARTTMHDYLPIYRSETFYTMASGGLGWGLPAAIGIKLGKPDARVIALIGDGSSMYAIQALWTAAQLALPMVIVILNNKRYAALEDFAQRFGFAKGATPVGTALDGLDFVALAEAQGCKAIRVARADQLREVLLMALASAAPILIEVELDR